jgi:actin-related protein
MPESVSTIEQDIVQLEKQLREKKASLEGEQKSRPEKELLKEVTGERIRQHLPEYQAKTELDNHLSEPQHTDADLKNEAEKFVNIVLDKNLEDGIKQISDTRNPALIDVFHDLLVDELYDRMIREGKLDQVK